MDALYHFFYDENLEGLLTWKEAEAKAQRLGAGKPIRIESAPAQFGPISTWQYDAKEAAFVLQL